jgi:NOL1/NOP2/sun family putative RNA methylase
MSRLLGDEYPAFARVLDETPIGGLRVNTLKLSAEEFRGISPVQLGGTVPWEPSAFTLIPFPSQKESGAGEAPGTWVKEPGKHPFHLAGLYYLQDPSAMSAAVLLDPQPGERVLDLAASPGGKTTHMAALMQGQGLLVANEIKDNRVGHLAVNVERWGADNVVITNETPERLADHFGPFFDRVLVDAPCSGEGMFRKDMGARRDWSPEMVTGCSLRQRAILRVAAKLVRPGGCLMYSTCTFAPEEDEQAIAFLLESFPEYEVSPLPHFPGFMSGRPEWLSMISPNAKYSQGRGLEGAVRLFPHRLNGEGHFVCLLNRLATTENRAEKRIKKDGNLDRLTLPTREQERLWHVFSKDVLKADFAMDRLRVRSERLYLIPERMTEFGSLRVLHPGVWLGTVKKARFEPAHPLALFLRRGQAGNVLNLSAWELGERRSPLQAYLRGETISSEGASGWILISVDGWPLGWGKRVQGIVKNHFPHGWQIYS